MTNSEAKDTLKMIGGIIGLMSIASVSDDNKNLFTQICTKYNEAAEIACLALDDQIELEKKEGGMT